MAETYEDKINDAIASEVNTNTQPVTNTRFVFSSGVVCRIIPTSMFIIQNIMNKFKMPDVPMEYNERVDRVIANPNSPSYVEKRAEVAQQQMEAVTDALMALTLVPIEVPDHVMPLESDEWIEMLALVGVEVDVTSPRVRKQKWLKYIAATTQDDLKNIYGLIGKIMGASDEEVAEQMNNFRGNS